MSCVPLPDTAAHSGRFSATEAVLSILKAVSRTRCGQVLTDKLQIFELALRMLIVMPPSNIFLKIKREIELSLIIWDFEGEIMCLLTDTFSPLQNPIL